MRPVNGGPRDDFWGDAYDGAKHPDKPEPGDWRPEPDDDRERFDPALEATVDAWPETHQEDEQ